MLSKRGFFSGAMVRKKDNKLDFCTMGSPLEARGFKTLITNPLHSSTFFQHPNNHFQNLSNIPQNSFISKTYFANSYFLQ